jgi:anthranilate synthase component 2
MILIIDNYDSFTYNLYQMVGEICRDIVVKRNDEITLNQIKKLKPQGIIISPGPGNPENSRDFGVCMQVIHELGSEIPILGVCLGHQGIFSAFGGEIIRTEPVHGKISSIFHSEEGIFMGVENPLPAARYHSLLCKDETTPKFGLQFHPESVGTSLGIKILENFLEIAA